MRSARASTGSCISAAIRSKAPGTNILQSNIIGCYNLFRGRPQEGRQARRVRVVEPCGGILSQASPDRDRRHRAPDSRYGVSKVFGEAVGALYADKHGLKVTCVRIGNFGDKPLDHRRLSIWLKPEDLVQLCRIGLDHPDIHFEIFYGASYNERSWWDNHRAYDLGYSPHRPRRGFFASTPSPSRRSCRPTRSAIFTRAARSAAWSSTAT